MNKQEPITKAPKKRSKIITVLAWLIVVCLVPACCAWIIGRRVYWFDLIASQQMLISWIALIFMVLVLMSRRWIAGVVCLALVCVSFSPVLVSREWTLARVNLREKPDGAIRIVSCNMNPENESWEKDLSLLLSLDADVVVLIEVHPELSRSIRNRQHLDSSPYARWAHRAWVKEETTPCFILSQWPMNTIGTTQDPEFAQDLLYTRIYHPNGEFVVGLAHPYSPRTQQHWTRGNQVVQAHGDAIAQLQSNLLIPIILCTDLNAGPAQQRAKTLRAAGLRMSKPVLYGGGSYPANSSIPEPLQIQLDDVWATASISPIAWTMLELSGSDHKAVVVDFKLTE